MLLTKAGSLIYPAAVTGGWATLIPQSGLLSAWPFDTANTSGSQATDPIGGVNAALTNVTQLGSGPTTSLNNAGVFNGSSSTAITTGYKSLPSSFSIVFWMEPTAASGSPRLIANGGAGAQDNSGICWYWSGNVGQQVIAYCGNGTTSVNGAGSGVVESSWNFIAVTYDGSTIKTSINAGSQGSVSLAGPIANDNKFLSFGYNPVSVFDFFTGNMAGIALYNRTLTTGEITTIFGT